MVYFLDACDLLMLNQRDVNNLKWFITTNKIETVTQDQGKKDLA